MRYNKQKSAGIPFGVPEQDAPSLRAIRSSSSSRGVLPIMAYTGRLRPKGELFPGVCIVYERVGFSPVKVQERVGKSAFSVCKKAQRIKDAFYVCAKARLCDLFIFQKQCINLQQ